MITAATWVPRGKAAQFPQRFELSESEYDRIGKLADLRLQDAREDLEEATAEEGGEGDQDDENNKAAKASDAVKARYNCDSPSVPVVPRS